jgi:site-specific recombinase XerD
MNEKPETKTVRQGSYTDYDLDAFINYWVDSFLYDRKTQNMSDGTLHYYRTKLRNFIVYCESQQIARMDQITPDALRRYMTFLEDTGHNAGGRHALYRAIKSFLLWYENEAEPENWKNPIRKITAPRVPVEPLDPVPMEIIKAMEDTCEKNFLGNRDRAIMLALLDTGARASEFLDLNTVDVDLVTGSVLIRQGKGRKPRMVYIGSKTKRALRLYLRYRSDSCPALWVCDDYKRLSYSGLRWVIARRSETANVRRYGLHAFRRQFAITMLRKGVDLATLARLMGHNNLVVLMRYLKQLPIDLQNAHTKAGPVDSEDL